MRRGNVLAPQRTTYRQLARGIDRKAIDKKVILPNTDRALVRRSDLQREFQIALRDYSSIGNEDVSWVHSAARWKIPPTEYGEPTPADLAHVARRAVAVLRQMTTKVSLAKQRTLLPDTVQKEIDASVALGGEAALSRLAAWRALYDHANDCLMAGAETFYSRAFDDLVATSASAPQDVVAALKRDSALHGLLYHRTEALQGDLFFFIRGQRLLMPRVVGYAQDVLGEEWWCRLVRAIDAGNVAKREEAYRQMNALAALVSQDHSLHGVGGKSTDDEHDILDDRTASDDPTPADDAVAWDAEALIRRVTDSPARDVKAALLHAHGRTFLQIGNELGVSFGRAKQLADRGLMRLRENPALRELFED